MTSDGMEQIIIFGNGALRVTSEAFYAEFCDMLAEIRALL